MAEDGDKKKEAKQKNFEQYRIIRMLLVGIVVVIILLACNTITQEFPFPLYPAPTNTPFPTLTLSNSGKIAFVSRESQLYDRDHLWIVNADGSNLEQLTSGREVEIIWIEWSPDGKYILFLLGGKLWDLEINNLENSNQVPNLDFLNAMHLHNGFSLSPDGKKIVYQWAVDAFWDWNIWLMDIDGSNQVQLTDSGGGGPSWSPDGNQIAYYSEKNCDPTSFFDDPLFQGTDGGNSAQAKNYKISVFTPVRSCSAFWVMNADGSNQIQLTDFPIGGVAWSPDSTKIAFVHEREGGIWMIDVDGSRLKQLTTGSWEYSPRWSPDGSKIAFNSIQSGNYDIWLMDTNGRNQVQLTNDPADDKLGSWSPDASKIVFSSKGNIWIINKDGSGLTQLTSEGGPFYYPVWQPASIEALNDSIMDHNLQNKWEFVELGVNDSYSPTGNYIDLKGNQRYLTSNDRNVNTTSGDWKWVRDVTSNTYYLWLMPDDQGGRLEYKIHFDLETDILTLENQSDGADYYLVKIEVQDNDAQEENEPIETEDSSQGLGQNYEISVISERVLEEHNNAVYSVAWSPDGSQLASAGKDNRIIIWSVESGTINNILLGHSAPVWAAIWSPNGEKMASTGEDGTIRIWDTNTGALLLKFEGNYRWAYTISWSPDGTSFATGSYDGIIRIWDASSGNLINSLNGRGLGVWGVDWAQSGNFLASSHGDGRVRIWDVNSGEIIETFNTNNEDVYSVKWSNDERMVVTSSKDSNVIQVWQRGSGLLVTNQLQYGSWCSDWSPIYNNVYISGDSKIRFWDLQTGTQNYELGIEGIGYYAAEWSPDGMKIAAGANDGNVYIWEISLSQ